MDVYAHLFELSNERTADAMEAMFEAAVAAPVAEKMFRIG